MQLLGVAVEFLHEALCAMLRVEFGEDAVDLGEQGPLQLPMARVLLDGVQKQSRDVFALGIGGGQMADQTVLGRLPIPNWFRWRQVRRS